LPGGATESPTPLPSTTACPIDMVDEDDDNDDDDDDEPSSAWPKVKDSLADGDEMAHGRRRLRDKSLVLDMGTAEAARQVAGTTVKNAARAAAAAVAEEEAVVVERVAGWSSSTTAAGTPLVVVPCSSVESGA